MEIETTYLQDNTLLLQYLHDNMSHHQIQPIATELELDHLDELNF